jgi:PAS domain S-box-containing protein
MYRIHGRDPAAGRPSGKEYRSLLGSDAWAAWLTHLEKSIEGHTDINFEYLVYQVGTPVKRVQVTGRPIAGAANQITELIGSATEVTGEAQDDTSVSSTLQNPLRHLIDLIPVLAWSCLPDGTADYFNRGWLDYTGFSEHEALNWGWTTAFHPEDISQVVAYWQSLLSSGHPGEIQARLRRFDGEFRWFLFRARPVRDNSGRVIKWYGSNTDVEDRKRAEDALRESERELRQLVDSVPGMIAVANSKGEHEYANRRALDYTGTTVEDSRGLGFINTIHPEEQELVRDEWIRCSSLRQPMDINHRWRRFDGVYRWFHVRVEPLFDEHGGVARWYGLLTDIEDRRKAEEALRESEQHLRLLVETLPAVVWRAAADGAIDYTNQRLEQYIGQKPPLGSDWVQTLHPDDVDPTVDKWTRACQTGFSYDANFRLKRADGQYRWVQVIGEPLRNVQGRIQNWYGLMLDIDDRRRAEQALKERETHLSGVLETIPALVSRWTSEGKLEYVNQRVMDYFGGNLENIAAEVVHPDDRETYLKKWLSCLSTGASWEMIYRLQRVTGEYRWFQVRVEPILASDGSIAHWYAASIDINDSKEMEEALRNTRRRLSRAMHTATVNELSASIAHEINQPLASIAANAHACATWLSGDARDYEAARLTAERIVRDSNAAAEVVARIRALFQHGQPAMVLADINDIVVEVLRLIADEIRESGANVDTDLGDGLPEIVADRVQIQQTLINLVRNALEAMASIVERPRLLKITTRRVEAALRVEVRDTGCGITDPTSIFDPFFTTKDSGMGMGLAISRSIIEAHGGRLWAAPSSDSGTTFNFTVPLFAAASNNS